MRIRTILLATAASLSLSSDAWAGCGFGGCTGGSNVTVGTAPGNVPAIGSGGTLAAGVIPALPYVATGLIGTAPNDVAELNSSGQFAIGLLPTGTGAGQIPVLNSSGQLNVALLPTGTAAGQIPVLNSNGQIPAALLPPGSGGTVATATNTTAGIVIPDLTSIVAGASGKLSAIGLTGGADYLNVPSGAVSALTAPSTVANDMTTDYAMAIDMAVDVSAYPAANAYEAIVGKWSNNASSGAGEFSVFDGNSTGGLTTGFYTLGNGQYQSVGPMGTVPLGKGTLSLYWNFYPGHTFTLHGVAVPQETAGALWLPAGSTTWQVLGSASTGTNYYGFQRNGTSGLPWTIGDYASSQPMQVFSMIAYDPISGQVLANPNIASANTGTVANDSVGNVWTVGSGSSIVPAGSVSLALGDGSTVNETTAGVLSATPNIPLARSGVDVKRTLCARAGDNINVADLNSNPGGTIGSAFGTTIAAIAAHVATACDGSTYKPYAWLTDGQNHGGVDYYASDSQGQETVTESQSWTAVSAGGASQQFTSLGNVVPGDVVMSSGVNVGTVGAIAGQTVTAAAAFSTAVKVGDVLLDYQTRQTATVTAVSGTTYTLSSVWVPFIVGHYLIDKTSGIAVTSAGAGNFVKITAGTYPTVTYAGSGAIAAMTNGATAAFEAESTATAAGATTSTALAVASTAPAAAGLGVYDATQQKTVGTIATGGVTSATALTLAANALVAVAANDVLFFYQPTMTSWIEDFHAGQNAGFNAHVAMYEDPNNMWFYPQVGDTVTASCLPTGDTISAIDTVPSDPGYGHITLAVGATSYCPVGTGFSIALPDSQATSLSSDWVALETALYLAQQSYGTGTQRTVNLPDGPLYPNRPIQYYANASGQGTNLTIRGNGSSSIFETTDAGPYKCALTPQSLNSGSTSTLLTGFNLYGPGAYSGTSLNPAGTEGVSPSSDNGICLTDGQTADHVTVEGFHSGVGMLDDHNEVNNSTLSLNLFGLEFLPLSQTLGNQVFENNHLTGNYQAGFAAAASNQWDSGTMLETHCGFSAYCWYREAASPIDPYSGYSWVTEDTIIDNWLEGTGNGAIMDASGSGIWDKDTIIHADGSFNTPYQPGSVPQYFRELELNTGSAFQIDALAEAYVAGWTENTVEGGQPLNDLVQTMLGGVVSTGSCFGNLFLNADSFVSGNGTTHQPFVCATDGGGNMFEGSWSGFWAMAGSTASVVGGAVSNGAGGIVPTNSTTGISGYVGAAPLGCAAGTMCEVVQHGRGVLISPDAGQGTANPGTGYLPDTSGYFTIPGTSTMGVAVSEGAITAQQVGRATLR